MKRINTVIILTFLFTKGFASNPDSVFVQKVKKFIVNESGFAIDKTFYDTWGKTEKPTVVVYVSQCDKVASIDNKSSRYTGINEDFAKTLARFHESEGHHVFIYKTYATSIAELNNRFISYSVESKCFIILHEFIHHFKRDLGLAIPYEYEEALADVVGNYGAMEFNKTFGSLDPKILKNQKLRNEKIYKIINKTSIAINSKPERVDILNSKCQNKIERVLTNANSFQKDRFAYSVNNAYLLKNRYYSEKYFLLQKLFQKSGTLSDFLNIFKDCPQDSKDFEPYLNNFL